jgi:hypothetical protein
MKTWITPTLCVSRGTPTNLRLLTLSVVLFGSVALAPSPAALAGVVTGRPGQHGSRPDLRLC